MNHPRLHPITATINFEQNLFNKFGHVPPPKPALAMTAIQPGFEFPALRGIIRLFQNGFILRAARHWKGIIELKRDELRHARRVEVRQKSTLMPATKTFFQFFDGWIPIPLAFAANEFKQAEIFRRGVR